LFSFSRMNSEEVQRRRNSDVKDARPSLFA
jgi:hypothetical protein